MKKLSSVLAVAGAFAAFLSMSVVPAQAAATFKVYGPWRTSYEQAWTDSWRLASTCYEQGGQPVSDSESVVPDWNLPLTRYQAVMSCTAML